MKLRKILACVLAVAMMASFALTASASGPTQIWQIGANRGWPITGSYPRWQIDVRQHTGFEVTFTGTIDTALGNNGLIFLQNLHVGALIPLVGADRFGNLINLQRHGSNIVGRVERVTIGGNEGFSIHPNPEQATRNRAAVLVNENALIRNITWNAAGNPTISFNRIQICEFANCVGQAGFAAGTTTSLMAYCGVVGCTGQGWQNARVLNDGGRDLRPGGVPGLFWEQDSDDNITLGGSLFVAAPLAGINQIRHGQANLPITVTLRFGQAFGASSVAVWGELQNRIASATDDLVNIRLNRAAYINVGLPIGGAVPNHRGQWFGPTMPNTGARIALDRWTGHRDIHSAANEAINMRRDVFTNAEMREIANAAREGAALRVTAHISHTWQSTDRWGDGGQQFVRQDGWQQPFTPFRARVERIYGRDAHIDVVVLDFGPEWWNWMHGSGGGDTFSFVIPADVIVDDKFDWNVEGFDLSTWDRFGWQFIAGDVWINFYTFEVINEVDHSAGRGMRMGDVDGDGRVTVADALLALRLATGQTPAAAVNPDAAKIGGGDTVTVSDALAILLMAI
jgi:hypothetical protein